MKTKKKMSKKSKAKIESKIEISNYSFVPESNEQSCMCDCPGCDQGYHCKKESHGCKISRF